MENIVKLNDSYITQGPKNNSQKSPLHPELQDRKLFLCAERRGRNCALI